jgi:hypothetical protein
MTEQGPGACAVQSALGQLHLPVLGHVLSFLIHTAHHTTPVPHVKNEACPQAVRDNDVPRPNEPGK